MHWFKLISLKNPAKNKDMGLYDDNSYFDTLGGGFTIASSRKPQKDVGGFTVSSSRAPAKDEGGFTSSSSRAPVKLENIASAQAVASSLKRLFQRCCQKNKDYIDIINIDIIYFCF